MKRYIQSIWVKLGPDVHRFYGISKCKVNLNLTRLLRTGKITPSELEKLKTLSNVGIRFHLLNILVSFVLFGITFLFMLALKQPFYSSFSLIISPLVIGLGLLYSFLEHQRSVLLIGLLIVGGLFLGHFVFG